MTESAYTLETPRGREVPVGLRPFYGAPPWGTLFGAYWLVAVAMASLAECPVRFDGRLSMAWAVWAAMFTLTALMASVGRVIVHEIIVTMSVRERTGVGILVVGMAMAPGFFDSMRIVPHGPLWSAIPLLAMAVRSGLARCYLAWTLMGAWLAAGTIEPDAPWVVQRLVLFGVSWIFALGATHLVFTADAHEIDGSWIRRRAALNALPAALAAVLGAGAFWMLGPLHRPRPRDKDLFPNRPDPKTVLNFDNLDLWELFYNLLLLFVMVTAAFALLYFLRRWLMKRAKASPGAEILPGVHPAEVAPVEAPEDSKPYLAGWRGRIVKYWTGWAAAAAKSGHPRKPGETAAEYARRLGAEDPGLAPDPAMTELLERAHYAPDEVGQRDAEEMKKLVRKQRENMSRSGAKS